jgi:hypothetical protein
MRKLINIFSLVCLVLFVLGCELFKETTGSDKEKLPGEKTFTVDEIGGTIAVDGFQVSIPEGALSGEMTVKIKMVEDTLPWAGHLVSEVYQIEGLPADLTMPLQIRIRYQGKLQATSLICRSMSGIIPYNGTAGNLYRFFTATDSSDYLIGSISTGQSGGLGKSVRTPSGETRQTYAALTGFSQKLSEHFRITLPQEWNPNIKEAMSEIMEENYTVIKNLGFSFSKMPSPPWEVYAVPFSLQDQKRYGMFLPELDLKQFNYLFDEAKVHDMDLYYYVLRAAGGRELFHSVLSTYDQKYFQSSNGKVEPSRFWWHHAVASWAEEEFVTYSHGYTHPLDFETATSYDPAEIIPLASFRGLQTGAGNTETTALKHGGGMTVFVKYLVTTYGKKVLPAIYHFIGEGDAPVNALIKGVKSVDNTAVLSNWWPEFFKSYMLGKLYGLDESMFMDAAEGTFSITSDQSTEATFDRDYPDLSARIFHIQLEYEDLSPEADLQLTLTGQPVAARETRLMLFQYSNTSGEFLQFGDEAYEQITVSNCKTLMDQGYKDLYSVVVNSHVELPAAKGTSGIILETKLLETQLAEYNRCSVNITVTGQWNSESGPSNYNLGGFYWSCEDGEFTDKSFTHKIDRATSENLQGYKYGTLFQRELKIEFDPNDFTITRIEATMLDSSYSDLVADNRTSLSFILLDCEIPVVKQGKDIQGRPYIVCEILGDAVCVQTPDYKHEIHTYDRDGNHTWLKLEEYNCTEDSKISIQFWNEEE